MRWLLATGVVMLLTQHCVAPPVVKNKDGKVKHDQPENPNNYIEVEYHKYLTEVVDLLKSDPHFVKKLENLTEEDLKTAKIANELDNLNITVRSKLDEVKRIEIKRLTELANKMYDAQNGLDMDHLKIPQHLDIKNHESFETIDLERLILQATKDLEKEDQKRRQEFSEYEMHKRVKQEAEMKGMDKEHAKKYEEELEMIKKKRKDHKPLHHPGSKQQLEEVWEEKDHMDPEQFDPHVFFVTHDVDDNKFWDPIEVKALFIPELDKMYRNGEIGTDPREREEEMERMREHLFNETDTNRDGLISYDEFIKQTQKHEFNEDEGWKTVAEEPVFTEEEYQNYLRHHQQNPQYIDDNSVYPQQYEQVPIDHGVPPYQQQQFHGQAPPQQQFHGQVPPQQQQFHGQAPQQQQQFHGQVPPQEQQFHGQVPPQQQQFHGQLPPQQQYHEQIPPQHIQQHQQQYPNHQQIPQYQAHPAQNQVQSSQYNQEQTAHQQQYVQQIPAQQQHLQQDHVAVQQRAAVPVQQKSANQANVETQQTVAQQNNVESLNDRAQQQSTHNEVPVVKREKENLDRAPVPNVVKA